MQYSLTYAIFLYFGRKFPCSEFRFQNSQMFFIMKFLHQNKINMLASVPSKVVWARTLSSPGASIHGNGDLWLAIRSQPRVSSTIRHLVIKKRPNPGTSKPHLGASSNSFKKVSEAALHSENKECTPRRMIFHP